MGLLSRRRFILNQRNPVEHLVRLIRVAARSPLGGSSVEVCAEIAPGSQNEADALSKVYKSFWHMMTNTEFFYTANTNTLFYFTLWAKSSFFWLEI